MNVIALLPVNTVGLPKYPPPPRATIEHSLYPCDRCKRDCWIGPTQRAMRETVPNIALCYFCIFEEMRQGAEIGTTVVLNPGIEDVQERT